VGFFLQFSSSERTAMLARGEPLATQLIQALAVITQGLSQGAVDDEVASAIGTGGWTYTI
jgi:hypothetical protein